MYHPEIIARRETALYRERPDLREHFPYGLPRYSIDESQELTAVVVSIHDDTTAELARPLTEEEGRFVQLSQVRCSFDFPYFAERFVWIDESGAGIRPLYPLWESQRFAIERLGVLERQRIDDQYPDGLLLNVLKARQLGISTLSESLIAHRLVTRPYLRALAGADVEDQAGYLFRMVRRIYDQLPWFLRPDLSTFVKNREMTFGNQSYLKTAWGKSTRGALASIGGEGTKGAIGRGQTYSLVHISELATWDNPEQLDTALFPAIPVSPSTLVMLESTAEHAQDWWHQQWLATADGAGRFANLFIPWYIEPGKYSLPAPVDWSPSSTTLRHAEKCRVDSPRWLGREIILSRDQLYWYETTRAYYTKKNELHKFLKEYPADDLECFQYAGRGIFSLEQLEAIDAAGSRRPLIDLWRVDPAREIAALRREQDSVEAAPLPTPRDPRPAAPLAPRLLHARGPGAAHEFPVPPGYGFQRLTPTELEEVPNLRSGVLAIWEYPRARGRRQYLISVDVGDGLGQDYSVIDVIRLPTIEEPTEQVAQYCSNVVDTKTLAFICDAIGRLYADREGLEALAAIEINNHGLAVQDMLQLHLGYSNFYVWEYADSRDQERRFSTKIGWVTTQRTRPLLLSAFHAAITTQDPISSLPDFILNSPVTRGELRHFVTDGILADAAAARGQHDDAVMAAAIGYYVAWRTTGGETEPIDEKRRRRTAAQALRSLPAGPPSDRNRAITHEESRTRHAVVGAEETGDDTDGIDDGEGGGGLDAVSYFQGGSGRDRDRDDNPLLRA